MFAFLMALLMMILSALQQSAKPPQPPAPVQIASPAPAVARATVTQAATPARPSGYASCQSASLCVHSSMPLVKQGNTDGTLYSQIASYYRISTSSVRDTFCAPAAGAMVLRTAAEEAGTRSSSSYLKQSAANSVFNLILAMNSNVTGGGTQISNVFFGIRNTVSSQLLRGSVGSATAPITNVNTYRASRPLQLLSVKLATGSIHTVSVNGSEGSYFKIFDPAGRVYNVRNQGYGFAYVNAVQGGVPTYFSSTTFVNTVSLSAY